MNDVQAVTRTDYDELIGRLSSVHCATVRTGGT